MNSWFTRANVSRLPRVSVQAFLNMQTNRVFAKLSALKINKQFQAQIISKNFKRKHFRTEQPLKSRRAIMPSALGPVEVRTFTTTTVIENSNSQ